MSVKTEKLSVIIPAYNEEAIIYNNLLKVKKALSDFICGLEIIVVNDGSIDHTEFEIYRAQTACPDIKSVSYKHNRGKGYAVKRGMQESSSDYIAFLDADLDLLPDQLIGFIETMNREQADAVIGSKMHKDSQIEYALVRRIMSRGYAFLLKVLFHMDIRDTQTGIKLFRAAALRNIIELISCEGYAYDLEILAVMSRRKYKIVEMPVKLVSSRDKGTGHIRIKDAAEVFSDTLKIFRKMHFKHSYD